MLNLTLYLFLSLDSTPYLYMNVSRRFYTKQVNTKLTETNFDGEIGLNNRRLKQVLMVFSGKKRGGGERESAEEDMERLKPLHNFDLPYLRWGNQKLLRCMNVDSNGDVSVADRNQSSESGGGDGYVIGTLRRNSDFEIRIRSTDGDHDHHKLYSSEKVTARIGVAGDGEIEATREKLMFDFQTEVGKMKDAILGKSVTVPPPPAAIATPSFNSPTERPWNLRTRRAACKAPRSPTNGTGNSSPVANEYKYPKPRPKFSVSLSRQEVEEDFMAMAGRRLPRKPKKRPRVVQKQLGTLFPGLWLTEITADLYKVPDEAENAKR